MSDRMKKRKKILYTHQSKAYAPADQKKISEKK